MYHKYIYCIYTVPFNNINIITSLAATGFNNVPTRLSSIFYILNINPPNSSSINFWNIISNEILVSHTLSMQQVFQTVLLAFSIWTASIIQNIAQFFSAFDSFSNFSLCGKAPDAKYYFLCFSDVSTQFCWIILPVIFSLESILTLYIYPYNYISLVPT